MILDFRQRALLHAVGQFQQRVFVFLRVVIRLERRRGRAEDDDRAGHFRAHHGHVARMVARRFFLFVRRILLLIHNQQRQIG